VPFVEDASGLGPMTFVDAGSFVGFGPILVAVVAFINTAPAILQNLQAFLHLR
jgi:hypothetical protein